MIRALCFRLHAAWPFANTFAHQPSTLAAWAGAAALLLATLLSVVLARQWQAQADAQLAAAQRSLGPVSDTRAGPQRPALQAVSAGEPDPKARLPLADQTPDRRAALMALARRHGVDVQRATEQADSAGQLQLALAGRARYTALRAFVAAALLADPALVLDRLRMQRASAAAADLDVDLQWTFLHRSTAQKAAVTPKVTRLARAAS